MSIFSKIDGLLKLEESDDMKNRDIVPMPLSRRRWGIISYISYWSIMCLCMSVWTGAVSLYAAGLNGAHIMGIVIIGNAFISLIAILNSFYGSQYHIGYSVYQRVVFGIYGSYFGVLMRSLLSVVWFALQAWIGGSCVTLLISTWSKKYSEIAQFGPNVPFTPQELIGLIVFLALNFPILFIKPEYFDLLLTSSSLLTLGACVGLFIWVLRLNNGHVGSLITKPVVLSSSDLGWMWIYGIGSWYSSVIAALSNQADYSRFNKRPVDSILGTIIGVNLTGFIVPLLAVITNSAFKELYPDEDLQTPADIYKLLLIDHYTPKVRAACCFAAVCLIVSQLAISTVANAIPGGMDLSTLFPKYINTKRGAIVVFLLLWPAQPWTYLQSGNTFIAVMNSFSIFISPMVAIYMCEYYVVRKRIIKLSDCYLHTAESTYWYTMGLNIKAFICFLLGTAPGLPGLIHSANDSVEVGDSIYYFYGSFIFQFTSTFLLYWIANLIYPSEVGSRDDTDYFNTFTDDELAQWNIAGFSDYDMLSMDLLKQE
ncbi:nucleobase cation symporter-1 family protein Ecym_5676 [Eremothecium cymbalariae DBVPG|uniref:Thiamine transporter n=1 Tax=Eremothecium cymbalariae (strain CBS 270.75 / DBVPG 7215 / KCTC 17166 / NRRL Y-17582) TaxID=931890 RepID=I6NEB4_ERECY|nr:hypothetical protein Ecym_5676 [Eremothecium cymbalariae DBVPG\